MGAYKIDVMLKDAQVEEFITLALDPKYKRDGSVSDWEFGMRDVARYLAERFIDAVPELEEYRPEPK